MNILKAIQLRTTGTQPACLHCIHFISQPAAIEAAYPGLTTMSSGYASVRDRDGICNHHQLYLSGRDSCASFERRAG
jgi:hypothetical protein